MTVAPPSHRMESRHDSECDFGMVKTTPAHALHDVDDIATQNLVVAVDGNRRLDQVEYLDGLSEATSLL